MPRYLSYPPWYLNISETKKHGLHDRVDVDGKKEGTVEKKWARGSFICEGVCRNPLCLERYYATRVFKPWRFKEPIRRGAYMWSAPARAMASLQDLHLPFVLALFIAVAIYAGLFALLNGFAIVGLIDIAATKVSEWIGATIAAIAAFFGIVIIKARGKARRDDPGCDRCAPGECPPGCTP